MTSNKQGMQETSLLAYSEILGSLGKRQAFVYSAIRELESCNSSMISKHLKIPINCVCGRVNEMVKAGIIIEDKKGKCPINGTTTIFWKVWRRL